LFARGLGSSIAGYFSSQDSYSSQVHKYSNQHEMFYLSADNLNLSDEFTYGVLAHEFQHMIHWHLDRNEETWMNEGFSELATLLNNYDVGGFDYLYAQDPDKNLTYWPSEPGTTGAYYGHSFLFLSYFLQRFGHEATQALVANPDNGLDSVDESLASLNETDPQTGNPVTADDVYRDWGVAMVLQDAALDDGRYAITEYSSAPRAAVTDQFDSCPMGPQDRTVNQYGVDYMEISCNGQHTIHFNGASLVPVVPADPHGGDFDFYSNKGDESDMTLTHAFDLSGTQGPIDFSYWTWFDIEDGWDYVYLEASDDNGATWKILQTPSGTDRDPSGNAYGWGYTGLSGGSSQQATWIKESVDLSDYAGKQVMLRFEYVTDAAVNGEGFLVDDMSIDAINYSEGFEQDDGGWQADGFVRLYNRLPQTYQVALISEGNAPQVQTIQLDDNRDADIPVTIGNGFDRVILMVIGTTRHTWQASPYTISVSP
jgi:immune inhibitor A